MLVLLVRHGHAASKREWQADDKIRPLDEQGLVETGGACAPRGLVGTSTDSVEPLPTVHTVNGSPQPGSRPRDRELGELDARGGDSSQKARAGSSPTLRPRRRVHPSPSHPRSAIELGETRPSNFNAQAQREKGSIWVLERSSGRFVSAHYMAPFVVPSLSPRASTRGRTRPGATVGASSCVQLSRNSSSAHRLRQLLDDRSLQTAGHSACNVLRRARSTAIS